MDIRQAFAKALRQARKTRGLTQEDFSLVSSRTYLSTLERGLKSPTLDKIQSISEVLGIHPLTLLLLAFGHAEKKGQSAILERMAEEVSTITQIQDPSGNP